MGKVRKKMRNRKVADAVCNLIEQLKSENVLTNDEADDYYRRLEKVFKTGELRPRGYYVRFPLVETAKERLINKRLEMDFHKPNIPGDKPAPVKKVKVSRIKKEEVPAVVKEKRKLFSFFTRKPAAV